MLRITLAFPDRGPKAEPKMLYLGHDAEAALAALKDVPEGSALARVYVLGAHLKQRVVESEVAPPAPEPKEEDQPKEKSSKKSR